MAYRECGAGPPLALIHSAMLSHKEWEPSVEQLAAHFRVVLPDLPLHGDSEDSPTHPYTLDWFAEVLGGFAADVLGPSPLIGGHGAGAEVVLQAVASGRIRPRRLVLMSNRLHAAPERGRARSTWRPRRWPARSAVSIACRLWHAHRLGPSAAPAVRARQPGGAPTSCGTRSRTPPETPAWPARGRSARALGRPGHARICWRCTRAWTCPCCCCGPTRIACTRSPRPRPRCESSPTGAAVLPGAGFLMAYDDPVGLARELAAFCG